MPSDQILWRRFVMSYETCQALIQTIDFKGQNTALRF